VPADLKMTYQSRRKMSKFEEILDELLKEIRSIAENQREHMSHDVYERLWNVIQGTEHEIENE